MIPFTTLKQLREAGACTKRYAFLRKILGKNYGDNTPVALVKILEINGLDDALWVPESAISGDYILVRYRLFAVACCQDILHLMQDNKSRDAVKIAHLYAHGEASHEELTAAWTAAWTVWAAYKDAAWAAGNAAGAAAWEAAKSASGAAAWAATWAAAGNTQTLHFKIIFGTEFD